MSGARDDERALAKRLRLRGLPPPAVRLSRRAVLLTAGIAAAALAAVTGWALTARRQPAVVEQPAPPRLAPPERLLALPRDYLRRPSVGPSGRPPEPPVLVAPGGPGAASTALDPAKAEADRARASGLFVPGTSGGSRTPPAGEREGDAAPAVAARASPTFVLAAGETIRAALTTAVRSDLPGPVAAQVTENVFDTATGRRLLVPQGSRLLGDYARPAAGQGRLPVTWTRLVLPDGRTVELGDAPGLDADGAVGLAGRVDRRRREMAAGTLAALGLATAGELAAGEDDRAAWRALRRGGVDVGTQVGGQVVGRALDAAPRIALEPGHPVRVRLARDVALEAWLEG